MEEGTPCKPLKVSSKFWISFADIYSFSLARFGNLQAEHYDQKIENALKTLSRWFLLYPECRHIRTKSQMYRNIILDAHLIIYRVTKERIEVLDIVHSSSSVSKIRSTRSIQI